MPTITLSKRALSEHIAITSEEWLKERISYLGTDLESIEDDDITVEVFPNRPDLLSQQGFTRAMKSFCSPQGHIHHYSTRAGKERVIITTEVKEVRPFTACAIIRGLKLDDVEIENIIQMQEKLHVTYGRNRERCAIGVYPLESITLPITYTAKNPTDIRFQPLESPVEMNGEEVLATHPTGKEYAHLLSRKKLYPIFVDAAGEVLSMPPIINSEKTGRVKSMTKDVFVECSGHSWHVVSEALNMLCCSLSDMGGTIEQMTLEYPDKKIVSPQLDEQQVQLDVAYAHNYLGYEFSTDEIVTYLARMGIRASAQKGVITAFIPPYRTDILHPIDLVEDIAIGYGLEHIKGTHTGVVSTAQEDSLARFVGVLREALIGHGLIETKSYCLTNERAQTNPVKVLQASSQEHNTLRTRLIPTLLGILSKNKRYEYPQHLFETGEVFTKDESYETGVKEDYLLCTALCSESSGYTGARQVLDSLIRSVGLELRVEPYNDELLIEGRVGKIVVEGVMIGLIGEVAPNVLEEFELDVPVSVFEIDVRALHRLVVKN